MKKGFTLIELLAVIVILAIIALIATPIILGIINDAKEQSNERSIELYIKGVELSIAKKNLIEEFHPSECIITNGVAVCDGVEIDVDVDNSSNINGKITFNEKGIVTGNTLVIGESVPQVSICEFEDGTYGEKGQIGAKYHCDTNGDGTKDNYFYLLNNSVPYNLIMDRNYTDDFVPATMKWCISGDDNSCNHDNLDQYIEHIEELWTNVDSVSLPTANQIANAVGNTTWDSTNTGSAWFYLDSKTQTKTATSKGASSYAWLFDYTKDCESNGCNIADCRLRRTRYLFFQI